jgi:hypothetical protein
MAAESFSEPSAIVYQKTQRHIPEDENLHVPKMFIKQKMYSNV